MKNRLYCQKTERLNPHKLEEVRSKKYKQMEEPLTPPPQQKEPKRIKTPTEGPSQAKFLEVNGLNTCHLLPTCFCTICGCWNKRPLQLHIRCTLGSGPFE